MTKTYEIKDAQGRAHYIAASTRARAVYKFSGLTEAGAVQCGLVTGVKLCKDASKTEASKPSKKQLALHWEKRTELAARSLFCSGTRDAQASEEEIKAAADLWDVEAWRVASFYFDLVEAAEVREAATGSAQ